VKRAGLAGAELLQHAVEDGPQPSAAAPPLRSKRWLSLLLPLVMLALAAAAFAYLRATRAPLPPVQVEERAWLVQAVPVRLQTQSPQLLLYGLVSSYGMASLAAAIEAEVVEVAAREGQRVAEGALLVRLDDAELVLQLAEREADLAVVQAQIHSEHNRHAGDREALVVERRLLQLAGREVARIDDLVRRNMGSATQRDQALAELERQNLAVVTREQAVNDHQARLAMLQSRLAKASAARDRAALDLQRTRIRAPFAGSAVAVPVAVGDRVSRGTPVLSLVAASSLEVRAQVPNRHLAAVRAALDRGAAPAAQARVDGIPVVLELALLAAKAEAASGGVEALFDVLRGSEALTVGRIIAIVLDLPPVTGVVELPYEALYGLERIYRVEGGRMRPVPVRLVGERHALDGARRVLLSSPELDDGDLVVATQLPNAVSGLRVRVAGAAAG